MLVLGVCLELVAGGLPLVYGIRKLLSSNGSSLAIEKIALLISSAILSFVIFLFIEYMLRNLFCSSMDVDILLKSACIIF